MGAFGGGPVKSAQFPRAGKRWEIPLAQHLKRADSHRIGQVQTAETIHHGNAHALVGVVEQQFFRQPGGFFSEQQVALVGIGYIGVAVLGFCRKFPWFFSKNSERLAYVESVR